MKLLLVLLFVASTIFAGEPQVPAEVVADIKAEAAKQFPDEPSTQLFQVKKQLAAWAKLATMHDTPEKAKAARDWPGDYKMQVFVIERDLKAKADLEVIGK